MTDPTTNARWWKLYRAERRHFGAPKETLNPGQIFHAARQATKRYLAERA